MATSTTTKAPAAPKAAPKVAAKVAKAVAESEAKATSAKAISTAVSAFKAAQVTVTRLTVDMDNIQTLIDGQRVMMVRALMALNAQPSLQSKSGTRKGRVSADKAAGLLGVPRTSLANHFKALDVFLTFKTVTAPDAKPTDKELAAVREAWGLAAKAVAKSTAKKKDAPKNGPVETIKAGTTAPATAPATAPELSAAEDALAHIAKVSDILAGAKLTSAELDKLRSALTKALDTVETISAEVAAS